MLEPGIAVVGKDGVKVLDLLLVGWLGQSAQGGGKIKPMGEELSCHRFSNHGGVIIDQPEDEDTVEYLTWNALEKKLGRHLIFVPVY